MCAVGVAFTPKQPSTALAAARWCDTGQMPQIWVTILGASSTGLPCRNFSKPLTSMMFKRASVTLLLSSKSMVTWAWPSILDTGLI